MVAIVDDALQRLFKMSMHLILLEKIKFEFDKNLSESSVRIFILTSAMGR